MENTKNRLIPLFELIRRDTGINNAIDALEQLSLILFIKIIDDRFSFIHQTSIFKDLSSLRHQAITDRNTNFYTISDLLCKFINKLDSNSIINDNVKNDFQNFILKSEQWIKLIPLKIRSEKIFSLLIDKISRIEYHEINIDDIDSLINLMINESSSSGAFYTPRAIVEALSKAVKPVYGETVFDPAAGMGGFIVEVQKLMHLGENAKFETEYSIFGQDNSAFSCLLSSLKVLLINNHKCKISIEDSLLDIGNNRYDIIITSPPFGKISNSYEYREIYGDLSSNSELMFIKLLMNKVNINGRVAVVVPEGFLFNENNQYIEIRKELLTKFNLHTVLSFPANILYPYTGIKVSAIFFENKEPEDEIWFYEVSSDVSVPKTNQISEKILSEFQNFFQTRPNGENCYLVNKKTILDTTNINLSFNPPIKKIEKQEIKKDELAEKLKNISKHHSSLISNLIKLTTKINKLPSCNKIKLGSIIKTKAGQPLKNVTINEGGSIPIYGANGIIGHSEFSNRIGENILIGRVGAYCGNVYYTNEKIWLTDNSFSVELLCPEIVHMPYLAHALRALELNKLARGSAQPSISFSKIKDLTINIPSVNEQIELALLLDDISNLENEIISNSKLNNSLISELCKSSIFEITS